MQKVYEKDIYYYGPWYHATTTLLIKLNFIYDYHLGIYFCEFQSLFTRKQNPDICERSYNIPFLLTDKFHDV